VSAAFLLIPLFLRFFFFLFYVFEAFEQEICIDTASHFKATP
jgi:hypothetical protein